MDADLLSNYEYHRAKGRAASKALEAARADVARGKSRYASSLYAGWGGPWQDGSSTMRFVERPDRMGVRFVDYADKINRWLHHEGWFLDPDDMGETVRGAVFQLPAKGGQERYLAGFQDPFGNDAASIEVAVYDTKEEAARAADRLAEVYAEKEREYREAWNAGNRARALDEEVKETRAQLLALLREMKAARRTASDTPTICAILRQDVQRLLAAISMARAHRDELRDSYNYASGWYYRRDELQAAFAEGYGSY